MTPKVFLSLSFVDADFVRDIKDRLPHGLAFFYEESFENGEKLLHAMERRISETAVFVLFARKESIASDAVQFEIEEARVRKAFNSATRLLVFPTDSSVRFSDLPKWMQQYWTGSAGYSSADIARYITAVLLDPNVGISPGATKVIGRGKALDELEQLSADHLQRSRSMPQVYILAGFSGIGRKTFSSYYMRTALNGEAALSYGPTLYLSAQADLLDVYRSVRDALDARVSPEALKADQAAFGCLSTDDQVQEISRLLSHYKDLGQAVTLSSTAGSFEESGDPKPWVEPLLTRLPHGLTLIIVSNRQFSTEFVERIANAVQMRIAELSDKDTRALMIYTAQRLIVEDFEVPAAMVKAIGGHPDIANAAVRLAKQRGLHMLTRNPAYLYNVQRTILGETIAPEALATTEKVIMDALCWVPSLGGNLLEEIVLRVIGNTDDFVVGCERLVLGCLVVTQGYGFGIASSIRQLYRRLYVTPPVVLSALAEVLSRHWDEAVKSGRFREDLFEAFVFMHAFTGESLPDELKELLSPGTLEAVVKETYARGKNEDDADALERVISWGAIAEDMTMSDSAREGIMSTVVRAQLRIGRYGDAQTTIDRMRELSFSSVPFLQGHYFRRRGDYKKVIPFLEEAVNMRKGKRRNRSAVHELALSYSKDAQEERLDDLLRQHGSLISDSAMFLDFMIGIELKRGDLGRVATMTRQLRSMPDDEGRSDRREAQLLMRQGLNKDAKEYLGAAIGKTNNGQFHLRSLRSMAAARDKDFVVAKRDADFIKSLPGREDVAARLYAEINVESGDFDAADKQLGRLNPWTPQDWRLSARILEGRAEITNSISDRMRLRAEVERIRAQYGTGSGVDYAN